MPPLSNFDIVNVAVHTLYRCAQPDARGFAALRELGVSTVFKLNSEHEYPLKKEQAEFGGEVLAEEVSIWTPDVAQVTALASLIDVALAAGSVAVHCQMGRDRTGLAIGAWRIMHDGYMLKQATDEMEAFGAVGIVKLADHELFECLAEIAAAVQLPEKPGKEPIPLAFEEIVGSTHVLSRLR